ncbi:MAG: haloacid dehalogenase [Porticoccaceae bacterium]|nr:MAG: haloacid dehalogenase [Porticoccaceae bacterium]
MAERTWAGRGVRGVLLDLDGVFYVGDRLLPGAPEALERLERAGLRWCFVTNTTTRSAASLLDHLRRLGLPARAERLLTAPQATAAWLKREGIGRCHLAVAEAVREDFAGIRAVTRAPQAVVVGDIGNRWRYGLLDRLFRQLMDGARLVALHRNRYWETGDGLHLDLGAFVAALEYAADIRAVITGKPSPAFFAAALERLGVAAEEAVMVGDDLESDVGGAQAVGIRGVLVQTGKYRPELAARSLVRPDAVISSVADLPALLGC